MLVDEVLLRALADKLSDDLAGARIDKIFQPLGDLMVVELFPSPDKRMLALSCDRTHGFIGMVRQRPANPKEPPVFCRLCRKHLKHGRIQRIEGAIGDRLVSLFVRRGDEALILELHLHGGRPNLSLRRHDGTPLGKMLNYSHHHGSLATDPDFLPWPPPGTTEAARIDETDIARVDAADVARALRHELTPRDLCQALPGLSPQLARVIYQSDEPRECLAPWLHDLLRGNAPLQPTRLIWPLSGRSLLLPTPLPDQLLSDTARQQQEGKLYDAVEAEFYRQALTNRLSKARHELERALAKGKKRLTRRLCTLREGLTATARAEAYFHKGELLKTVLNKIRRRASAIEVFDWLAGRTVELELDPNLNGQGNLERLFNKAKKAKRSIPILEQQIADTEESLAIIALLHDRLATVEDEAGYEDIRQTLCTMGLVQGSGGKQKARRKKGHERMLRRYTSSDGYTIYVGRNSVENEYLTRRVVKAHDLWFHAHGAAGAHVVVKLDRGQTCPKGTVEEAAQLAAHFSKRRYDTRVQIYRTRGDAVKRPAGAPPGQVTLRHFDVLTVRPDPAIVRRLLGHEALTEASKVVDGT